MSCVAAITLTGIWKTAELATPLPVFPPGEGQIAFAHFTAPNVPNA